MNDSRPEMRLPPYCRVGLAALGLVLFALLGTAAFLDPDPGGFGTHQQLGLPPCSFISWFDMRCPSCGMTTAWSHMLHGHVIRSFQANAGGAVLVLTALLAGPWLTISAIRGTWCWRRPDEWTMVIGALSVLAITLVDWCLRIVF